ncbi:T9SS type A sorting domain-containing protein [Solirubrum puertoriconensis]|uniref:T9SS type A sorting domain-containing protein n=1 Tax=Solirubrum puertoriconensis TaxID=1751427 RepID=UPI00122E070B|nr:T9SS type A sorting domain-containing protein [Solirubrum puertoriconensis]
MAQIISGTALGSTTGLSYLGPNVVLQLNNASGLTLATSVTLNAVSASASNNGGLELLNGKLTTAPSSVLTLAANAALLGTATANSYVSGPMIREVTLVAPSGAEQPASNTVLEFPVGSGTRLRTAALAVTPSSSGTATYSVEVVEQAAPALALPASLERVSGVRYYRVQRLGGSASIAQASITLPVAADDYVSNPAGLRVAAVGKEQNAYSDLQGTVNGNFITAPIPVTLIPQLSVFTLASALGANNPLPVELTSFAATRQGQGVQLRWQTAQEMNSAWFEVQRSTDGKHFVAIERLAAAGTSSSQRTYSWNDVAAPTGVLYYRLLQMDSDGASKYSRAVTVASVNLHSVRIFPNPATDVIRLDATPQLVRWQVHNNLGQVLRQGTATGSVSIPVSDLRAGTYFLHVFSGAQHYKERFVKR